MARNTRDLLLINRSRAARIPPLALLLGALWTWVFWSCAEHWRGNPNYSYGWMVPLLAVGFALRRWWIWSALPQPNDQWSRPRQSSWTLSIPLLSAALIFVLEFAREQVWHPQIILWTICLLAIACTLAAFHWKGGMTLVRAEIFPVLFFLTAVPWPPRFEQPLTSRLMQWVAAATTESLHWLAIEAETSGAAIALRSGLVGITEACSGIRSLQAGIMFGLALGEWFLLRPARRVVLLAIAIALAFATNLARTLALSLHAEWNGVASVEQVHDLIGNIVITAMIAGIWSAGKLLAPRALRPVISLPQMKTKFRALLNALTAPAGPALRLTALACLAGFVLARGVSAHIDSQDQAQLVPFFVSRADGEGTRFLRVPNEIWNELHPTSGEFIRKESGDLSRRAADCYHFFWKPSPWNRFALVHRPDICMPGVGWKLSAAPEPVDVEFNGNSLRCYAFRFQRENYFALELWGVWRNGEPVSLDYLPAQILGAAPPPSLHLLGKRRSATEIVACSITMENAMPDREIAMAVLRSVFEYKRR